MPEKLENQGGDAGWVGDAWRDHLNGVSIYALAKQYGKKWETVRDNLRKHAANRAAELREGTDPTALYLDGLEIDLAAASRLMLSSEQDTAKIGALKHRTECRKLIAGGQGVSTETKNVKVGGDDDAPPLRVLMEVHGLDKLTEVARNGNGRTPDSEGS
jgi:hypothetical protein